MPEHAVALLKTIRVEADALMDDLGRTHLGLPLQALGWVVQFDGAKRRLGICKWIRKGKKVRIISLSRHYAFEGGWEAMEDVVRHEIAHAIDFETRGKSDHGPRWQAIARSVGADPTRLYDGDDLAGPPSKYIGICPNCGGEQPFYRRVKRAYACPDCCRKHARGKFSDRFRLRMVERATGREVKPRTPRPKKYTAYCPNCGRRRQFARRPKYEYTCKACCDRYAGGAYDPKFDWIVRQNY